MKSALICTRVADLATPHTVSAVKDCSLCGEKVWQAASSPRTRLIYCSRCAADLIGPNDEVQPLTRRQIADILSGRKAT